MPGRRRKADEPAPEVTPERAYDERGNVRPADDRYLTDAQVKARDAAGDNEAKDLADQLAAGAKASEELAGKAATDAADSAAAKASGEG